MITFKEITPDLASRLLEKNDCNRKLNRRVVRNYANDIQTGKWQVNGESIKIANDGTLLDGQHRLTAVVTTGIPIMSAIADNLDKEVFKSIDRGYKRSLGQVLGLTGVTCAAGKNTIICKYFKYKYHFQTGFSYKSVDTSTFDVIDFYDRNSLLVDEANKVSERLYDKIGCPRGISGGIYLLLSDYGDVSKFFEILEEPNNIPFTHPCITLRNTILKSRKPDFYVLSSWFIQAWNLYCKGKEAKNLYYNQKRELQKPVYQSTQL